MTDDKVYTHVRFNGEVSKVEWLGDPVSKGDREYGYSLYYMGNEYGLTHLIGARSDSDAYEYYVDSLCAEDDEYIHRAYGFPNDKTFKQFARLHKQDPQAAYNWVEKYNSVCRNWMSDRKATTRHTEIELNTDGITVPTDRPMWLEGYEMDSGGDIKYVGDNVWMHKA
jgi:hypothetical protein